MFVYRSVALGLLGACCLLLAMRPPISVVSTCPGPLLLAPSHEAPRAAPDRHPVPTLLDVAPGISRALLPELIHLAPGEQIASIDDVAVAGVLDAGMRLATVDMRSKHYIDLEIAGPAGPRRMLVLLH